MPKFVNRILKGLYQMIKDNNRMLKYAHLTLKIPTRKIKYANRMSGMNTLSLGL